MKHHQLFNNYPVLPIINQATAEEALVIAEAFLEADLCLMEMTLRTETAKKALLEVRKKFPNFILGTGSILSKDQMQWAFDAGMDFTVSPAWSDSLWNMSQKLKIPFFPGILSPSELLKSIEAGCLHPKIFPIEPAGGVPYLKSLLAPFQNAEITCLPTGGIGKEKVSQYLVLPEVQIVGGSWITPQTHINSMDAKKITELAKASLLLANTNS